MLYYGYKQAASSKQQAASSKQQAASSKQQAASSKQQAASIFCYLCKQLFLKKYHFVSLFFLFDKFVIFSRFIIFFDFEQRQFARKNHILKFSIIFLVLIFIVIKPCVALTTEIAKQIAGNKPFIKLKDGDIGNLSYLLSFYIQKEPSDNELEILPSQENAIYVVGDKFKFKHFVTKVAADGVSKNVSSISTLSYADIDGDTPHPSNAVDGKLTVTWSYKDHNGETKTLTAGQLDQYMDSCLNPYTLTIKAEKIKAQSLYGDPSVKDYGSLEKAYTINVDDPKICYVQPNSLRFYSASHNHQFETCDGTNNCKFVGGYNKSVFVPTEGFLTSGTKKFPTTGFNNAVFALKMSNSGNVYTFASSNPSLATITNEGVVTLKSTITPPLPFTVTLTAKS